MSNKSVIFEYLKDGLTTKTKGIIMELIVNKSSKHISTEIPRIVNETNLTKTQVIAFIEHIARYVKNKNGIPTKYFTFSENGENVEYVFCCNYELVSLVANKMVDNDFRDIDKNIFISSNMPYSDYAIKRLIEVRDRECGLDEVITELFREHDNRIATEYIEKNGAGAYLGTEYKFNYLNKDWYVFKLK